MMSKGIAIITMLLVAFVAIGNSCAKKLEAQEHVVNKNLMTQAEIDEFIQDVVAKEAKYFEPGIGYDSKSGMVYDHVRIDPITWKLRI